MAACVCTYGTEQFFRMVTNDRRLLKKRIHACERCPVPGGRLFGLVCSSRIPSGRLQKRSRFDSHSGIAAILFRPAVCRHSAPNRSERLCPFAAERQRIGTQHAGSRRVSRSALPLLYTDPLRTSSDAADKKHLFLLKSIDNFVDMRYNKTV